MLNKTRLTLLTYNQSGLTGALPHQIHFSVVFIDMSLLATGESRKVSHEEHQATARKLYPSVSPLSLQVNVISCWPTRGHPKNKIDMAYHCSNACLEHAVPPILGCLPSATAG